MNAQYTLQALPAAGREAYEKSDKQLGSILVRLGMLSAEEVECVADAQKEMGLRFGDTAVKLGVLDEEDLRYALSCQFNYTYFLPSDGLLCSEELVAALNPFCHQAEQIRSIRSQLLLTFRTGDADRQIKFAVVGPSHREGRSYLAANLAVAFAQVGSRTLLIDADLRTPRQHRLFGADNSQGLSTQLAGRAAAACVTPFPSLANLNLLPSGPIPPNPLELLSQSGLSKVFDQLASGYEVVLVDTPAFCEAADANLIAAAVGSAVVLARNDHTRVRHFESMIEMLGRSRVALAGSVINDFVAAA